MLGGGPAGAQEASLVESQPADGAELDEPPAAIVLTFDGEVGSANQIIGGLQQQPVHRPRPAGPQRRQPHADRRDPRADAGGHVQRVVVGQPAVGRGRRRRPLQLPRSSRRRCRRRRPRSPATTGADAPTTATTPRRRPRTTSLDASDVSDGATWLGRVLSTLGLAVLFGSLVLIVAAWPEGPEYILAVRFLRSVWLLDADRHAALRRGARARPSRASRSATG